MPTDNDLHKAAHKGDLLECKSLLECDSPIDINAPGASDRRALQRAAGAGHLEICQYFIDKGALVNDVDKSNRTALHWAAIAGHTEVVQLLLKHEANIFAKTSSNMTALMGAVEAGKVEVVKIILDHLPSQESKLQLLQMKNNDQQTAWDIASAASNKALMKILSEASGLDNTSAACLVS